MSAPPSRAIATAAATALAMTLATGVAVTQLALESAVGRPEVLPLLPIALVATWSVVRNPVEPALALPPVAWVLGAASEQPVGWLLIALVPALLLGGAARGLGPAHALAGAVLASGAGALAYLAMLAASPLPELLPTALATAGWTAAAALAVALGLRPFRPRQRGLFA